MMEYIARRGHKRRQVLTRFRHTSLAAHLHDTSAGACVKGDFAGGRCNAGEMSHHRQTRDDKDRVNRSMRWQQGTVERVATLPMTLQCAISEADLDLQRKPMMQAP
ncbi:hypothetical protein RAD15_04585 [Bradyrhizobium sp. 14AA]